MKLLGIVLTLLVSSVGLAKTQEIKPSYSCQCFQQVPFEAYIIFVVEKIGSEENWLPLEESSTQYDTLEICQAVADTNKICKDLSSY